MEWIVCVVPLLVVVVPSTSGERVCHTVGRGDDNEFAVDCFIGLTVTLQLHYPLSVELRNKRTTSPKGEKRLGSS